MRKIFGLISMVVVLASIANAQAVAVQQTGNSKSVPSKRLVTVDLKHVSLEKAVEEIAAQAGMRVTYGREVTSARNPVTVSLGNVPVDKAMASVLGSAGLVAVLVPAGDEMVIRPARGNTRVGQGVITGRITDAKTGKGVSGANISVDTDNHGMLSDENGTYRINGVSVGAHKIAVRLVGYAKQIQQVIVGEGAIIFADFKLEPSANVLDQVVVTGTVIASELKSVPNAITVVTAKQIEERGITRIDQLFRGDVPGLFAMNLGSNMPLDEVVIFSRGATALSPLSLGGAAANPTGALTNPIKTYIDGVELVDPKYLNQIDPRTIERIEILTGPQASTIYGSNAINGVMQIFTRRSATNMPRLNIGLVSGIVQNNFNNNIAPIHALDARLEGMEGNLSYNASGSADYTGPWTPARNTMRISAAAAGRANLGDMIIDGSLRSGKTQNRQKGDRVQNQTGWYEAGLLLPNGQGGLIDTPTQSILDGNTIGMTIGYIPVKWWSHELVIGIDRNKVKSMGSAPAYHFRSDTMISYSEGLTSRSSQRYTTTLQMPIGVAVHTSITLGVDHWRTTSSNISTQSLLLTGELGSPEVTRQKPAKNTGSFVQGQLGLKDILFLTYGLRAEWNPNYGDEAQPNYAPRYGLAYVQELGNVTAKFRASYGRSTRPPMPNIKLADGLVTNPQLIAEYGNFYGQLANPDLGPEFQQGGEGGIELYFGNRGSLVLTRYNQTVDDLIGTVFPVDSIRTLSPCVGCLASSSFRDADGHAFWYLQQYLNIGSIRNQGWELQNNVRFGPISIQGTYSWTKSRVIGITSKYSSIVQGTGFQIGRPFNYLPEHTWALTSSYTRSATNVVLAINSTGQAYTQNNLVSYSGVNLGWRYQGYRLRMNIPTGYRSLQKGYTTADLNVSRHISSRIEGILQVQNLTDVYRNDYDLLYATMGRQTKGGMRIKL